MAILNLGPFGFNFEVELRGHIERQWAGGTGLVFIFGEYHDDRDMITDNLIDSCALIRTGIVECVGVEDTIHARDFPRPAQMTPTEIDQTSLELFQKNRTDEGVIAYLRTLPSPSFHFGRTLSFLRPHLHLCCVEDPDLYDKACRNHNRLEDRGELAELKSWPDDPVQRERETKFVENLFKLWTGVGSKSSGAAILNTGSAHSQRCADRIREAGTSFIQVSQSRAATSYK